MFSPAMLIFVFLMLQKTKVIMVNLLTFAKYFYRLLGDMTILSFEINEELIISEIVPSQQHLN